MMEWHFGGTEYTHAVARRGLPSTMGLFYYGAVGAGRVEFQLRYLSTECAMFRCLHVDAWKRHANQSLEFLNWRT